MCDNARYDRSVVLAGFRWLRASCGWYGWLQDCRYAGWGVAASRVLVHQAKDQPRNTFRQACVTLDVGHDLLFGCRLQMEKVGYGKKIRHKHGANRVVVVFRCGIRACQTVLGNKARCVKRTSPVHSNLICAFEIDHLQFFARRLNNQVVRRKIRKYDITVMQRLYDPQQLLAYRPNYAGPLFKTLWCRSGSQQNIMFRRVCPEGDAIDMLFDKKPVLPLLKQVQRLGGNASICNDIQETEFFFEQVNRVIAIGCGIDKKPRLFNHYSVSTFSVEAP